MEDHLTTKQAAQALGISESSVKRWCDRGAIPMVKTLGGHRRIPLAGFLEFLRETNRSVVNPLSPQPFVQRHGSANASTSLDVKKVEFACALESGDEATCRKILTDAYAATESFALLADEFIAETFHSLGEKWSCGELEVYQERRGCEICSRILYEFRRLIPGAPVNAPLAIGGSPSGDNYSLPSQLIDLVLGECQWRSMNLGSNLPLETVLAAAVEHNPKMIWLSVSHLVDADAFLEDYKELHRLIPPDTMIVVGGRALTDTLRPRMQYTGFCDSMRQLSEFATALHGTRPSFQSSAN